MIKIERSASLNTVQDLGRTGWRHLGVSVSGAMDPLALRAGNILLGNDENAAAIEIQLFPFRVRFTADTFIALTGANCQARLDGKALPGWWGCPVREGQVLELSFPRYGARGYLCVAGGIHVPAVLGSRSTALRGSFGGFEGRELATGDTLDVDTPSRARLPKEGVGIVPPLQAMPTHFPAPQQDILQIRAIPAGEHGLFSADGQRFPVKIIHDIE